MYYCNNCDIAHEERNCPLCEAKEEIKSLEKYIQELENETNEKINELERI